MKLAIEIKELKNGAFKVLYTTPNGFTRTIGKHSTKKEAEKQGKEVLNQITEYWR